MSDAELAQVIAAIVLIGILAILHTLGRRVTVTEEGVTYDVLVDGATTQRTLPAGAVIPPADVASVRGARTRERRRSALAAIVVGKDNRTSTSKSVAFAWTLALVYGLLALLIAKWLGDPAGWNAQVARPLQEEYLLLLGGPYAAAILAKYAAGGTSEQTRTPAPEGAASASDLVTDDAGDTELGDFQYVVFALVGLAYFFGDFIAHVDRGLPDLPAVLTGLVLVSTGGYGAKKLLQPAAPRLTSVVPASAAPGASIEVYGSALVVPAAVAPDGRALPPTVLVNGQRAEVAAHAQILGADRLTVTVDGAARPGAGTVAVVRADGVAATGPAGSDGIPFTVTA
jgi:hypothetical protein